MSSDGRIQTAVVGGFNADSFIYTSYASIVTPNPINVLGSINAYNGSEPQSLRIFNATGVNSGEFGTFNWTGNNLIIGAQQSQSGILRDVVITGRNININSSGTVNFSSRPVVNNSGVLLIGETLSSNIASGAGGSIFITYITPSGGIFSVVFSKLISLVSGIQVDLLVNTPNVS